VQIHDVLELFRKKLILTDLASRIGEVITVDMCIEGGDFVGARVWLDVRKELTRFVSITPEGQQPVVMWVKFEKIPHFCAVCGFLGHTHMRNVALVSILQGLRVLANGFWWIRHGIILSCRAKIQGFRDPKVGG
jgi:hypothetical protein